MKGSEGRVALVTGGATGIGRSTSRALADRGIEEIYVGYAHSRDAAVELCTELEAAGATAYPLQADVADRDAVQRMAAEVLAASGGLDVLVCNAGTTVAKPFTDIASVLPDLWHGLLDVNLLGAFWVIQAFAESLKERSGSIVNVTSIAASRAVGSSLPYGVSKAALLQLTRGLAVALAPTVRVNAVSPGTVATGWHERLVGSETARHNAEVESASIPLGRVATADDIAEAVVTCALDLTFVTGQEIITDGGKALRY